MASKKPESLHAWQLKQYAESGDNTALKEEFVKRIKERTAELNIKFKPDLESNEVQRLLMEVKKGNALNVLNMIKENTDLVKAYDCME
jgi:hypothetical protein